MKKSALCILLALAPLAAGSYNEVSTSISNGIVNCITQDADGFIWMGTFRGLNRYNGQEFYRYYSQYDSLSIRDNQVKAAFCDGRGRLWVGTVNGPSLYDKDRDVFREVKVLNSNRNIQMFLETRSGDLLACNYEHILKYDPASCSFSPMEGIKAGSGIYPLVSPIGDLWVCTYDALRCYNPDTGSLKYEEPLSVWGFARFFMVGDELWISDMAGLRVYSTLSRSFIPVPEAVDRRLKGEMVSIIHPYGDGLLFYSELAGMFYFGDGRIISQYDPDFPFTVPDFRVSVLFTDAAGNLWTGSADQGFSVVYRYAKKYNDPSLVNVKISGKSVKVIEEDRDRNLWIVTLSDGMFVYDRKRDRLVPLSFDFDGGKGYRKKSEISGCVAQPDGDIWISSATYSKVLRCRYDNSVFSVKESYDVLSPMSLRAAPSGDIWCGTFFGQVYRIRKSDRSVEMVNLAQPFIMDFVSDILPMEDGSVMATLLYFPPKVIRPADGPSETWELTDFEPFTKCYSDCIKTSVPIPTRLMRDSEGDIWLGTVANGLIRYDSSSGKMYQLTTLPCMDVEDIQEDLSGNIWYSTQRGLGKWNRSDGSITTLFMENGIGGDQFYDRAGTRLRDGTIVFGGTHGLTWFDPLKLVPDEDIKLFFENIRPAGETPIPIRSGRDVTLSHRDNSFSLAFSALDFAEYQRVRFEYMLEGYDGEWREASGSTISYGNVPAGRYVFKVKALSLDLSRVICSNSINLRVKPSPWLSWWMMLIYLSVLSAAVALFLIQRSKIAREHEILEEAAKERDFFTNVSHEFRTPLTMISGPVNQMLDPGVAEAEKSRLLLIVRRNVDRMLRLVNQMTDYGKMEKDALKLSVVRRDIVPLLRGIAENFTSAAADKGIDFSCRGLEGSLELWFDEDKVEKICYNLLSNAFKYTPSGGKVRFVLDCGGAGGAERVSGDGAGGSGSRVSGDGVGVSRSEIGRAGGSTPLGEFSISVEDSGIGIPDKYKSRIFERYFRVDGSGAHRVYGTGIGLYYARSLAQLHHGSLEVSDGENGIGTLFTLTLPASGDAYSRKERLEEGAPAASRPFAKGELSLSPAADASNPASSSSRHTVMVVDDDIDVVHYMKEILSLSYNVICRFDADSAMSSLRDEPADLIILDVMMPGRSGLDFCRSLKSDLLLSHIPVILVTSKSAVSDQVEGLRAGADAYITKPFDPNYLMALVQSRLLAYQHLQTLIAGATDTSGMTPEEGLSERDRAFLDELYRIMEEGLSNSEIDINTMTDRLHISRSKLYYKIKGLTGENPGELFRHYKLNRAAELLKGNQYNVSEIAYLTGFTTLSHFSNAFKKQFGCPPSEYK